MKAEQAGFASRSADCRPFGFDLDDTDLSRCVVAKTAPGPVHLCRTQSAFHWVGVNVVELLTETVVVTNVVVIVTFLPEGASAVGFPTSAKSRQMWGTIGLMWGTKTSADEGDFERLDRSCDGFNLWFGDQQVDVFGHDYVAVNAEAISAAGPLQTFEKNVSQGGVGEIGLAMITTERQKVRLLGVMVASQVTCHGWSVGRNVRSGL